MPYLFRNTIYLYSSAAEIERETETRFAIARDRRADLRKAEAKMRTSGVTFANHGTPARHRIWHDYCKAAEESAQATRSWQEYEDLLEYARTVPSVPTLSLLPA